MFFGVGATTTTTTLTLVTRQQTTDKIKYKDTVYYYLYK